MTLWRWANLCLVLVALVVSSANATKASAASWICSALGWFVAAMWIISSAR